MTCADKHISYNAYMHMTQTGAEFSTASATDIKLKGATNIGRQIVTS